MKRKNRNPYPPDWKAIATRIKDEAGWCCIRCGHPHDPATGYTLTVHHADIDPGHSDPVEDWSTLWALCQRCHLSVQGRVDLDRPWVLVEHSAWAKPYMAGFYAKKYLGETLAGAEVGARLDELLALEARAMHVDVLPGAGE